MFKKIILSLFVVALLAVAPAAYADEADPLGIGIDITRPETAAVNGGVAVGLSSPFHFLDRFFERVQVAFSRGAEAKAKLEVKFAGERIAEIKARIEERGVEAPGLEKAQKHLKKNLEKAEKHRFEMK